MYVLIKQAAIITATISKAISDVAVFICLCIL
jgi:hypothetical protein